MVEANTKLPLAGIRVLDLATFIAGPFCGSLLAEFGAEVIKVEQPGKGDPLRRFGMPSECGDSLTWLSEARNRKSVTLDLRKPEGAAMLREMTKKADVIIENFRPGTLERWGIGFDALAAINPKLVMLRVSGYGQTGPYRARPGFARVAHAFSGLANLAREPGATPVIPGSTSLADYSSGLYGAFAVMVALRERDASGIGQSIDIALYESIFRMMDELVPAYDRYGFVREPMGPDTVNTVPHSNYQARDGRWIAIACSNDRMFERLADAMDRPELPRDKRYATLRDRDQHRAEVNKMVADWVGSADADAIVNRCLELEVPCSLLYNVKDIFEDPHYAARETMVDIPDSRAGNLKIPAIVPRLSRTPGTVTSLGPALGAHNMEVYKEWLNLDDKTLERLIVDRVI
jgi:crotonobetainyl-CoA:carnitine CoA-transferase CaiB-like acyl-CoA transferase